MVECVKGGKCVLYLWKKEKGICGLCGKEIDCRKGWKVKEICVGGWIVGEVVEKKW